MCQKNFFELVVRLELVPELQALLSDYEAMSQRLARLETAMEPAGPTTSSPRTEATRSTTSIAEESTESILRWSLEATVSDLERQILVLEERVSLMVIRALEWIRNRVGSNLYRSFIGQNESHADLAGVRNTGDSISSLSEQVAILEERLADCKYSFTSIFRSSIVNRSKKMDGAS